MLDRVPEVINLARRQGRTQLTEVEAKQLLAAWGIPAIRALAAGSRVEAVALARQLGLPVALKVLSPDISHKGDVGGVRLGLSTLGQVRLAYDQIMGAVRQRAPGAQVWGVSVQSMARPGVEVIIGMSRDPQFGPVLMFGLGGVLVEVLQDVAHRIAPITPYDAREMVREIKGYPLLCGYRGSAPAHLESLEQVLLQVSALAEAIPDIRELDLNPVFAYQDGAIAVDARILLEQEA